MLFFFATLLQCTGRKVVSPLTSCLRQRVLASCGVLWGAGNLRLSTRVHVLLHHGLPCVACFAPWITVRCELAPYIDGFCVLCMHRMDCMCCMLCVRCMFCMLCMRGALGAMCRTASRVAFVFCGESWLGVRPWRADSLPAQCYQSNSKLPGGRVNSAGWC